MHARLLEPRPSVIRDRNEAIGLDGAVSVEFAGRLTLATRTGGCFDQAGHTLQLAVGRQLIAGR